MTHHAPLRERDGRPSLREEHKRLTRARVLEGAVAVFGGKPLVDVTMGDIARAAGITRATVYAYFPGKREILQALLARVYDLADEVYAELAALPVWTRDGVRAWLEEAVARWRPMAPVIRVLTAAGATALGDADSARDRSLAAHEHYVALLTDASRHWRGTSAGEARQRALMMVLQVESFLSMWLAGGWPVETDDPIDLLADAVSHLLAPAMTDPAA
ncbi:TetR/AcrR family transcriptional regulator [Actinomadura opuntiae]|uniref:TetR/AcrR family transcriptional regulator n=1 Tax=Actinomadura sp. OS1-43 TaxID=604315 RepID=UPI00255AC5DD|nr:TetR/AcrR family transcriptional regulator [Actinomadura sp. OS1-43]MDL4816309.1 TetR/AcrR family transcriptional regulator [Actinomadura sp. OS1-43]